MTTTDAEPIVLRTDIEPRITALAEHLNDITPVAVQRAAAPSFVLAASLILGVDIEAVEQPFLAYAEALDERAAFEADPPGWMQTRDLRGLDTWECSTAAEVRESLAALLALAEGDEGSCP